jgi:glycogen(starch) synthase
MLADQCSRLGESVTLVTGTPGESFSGRYEIVRSPSLKRIQQLGRTTDIVFQNNISLKTLLPLLPNRKPVVICHQTWLTRTNGKRSWQDYLKLGILPICRNIAISNAMAASLPTKSVVIPNPFEIGEFTGAQDTPRTKDLVFLGRLVSDKGCDLALHALSLLKTEGLRPSLSIIGDGPELPALQRLTEALALSEQVSFLGSIREGRGREVARHKIMLVPSRWAEPFGVVALEGLAAGCAVVASSAGGLPEAVGPCGSLFPNGDAGAMAAAIKGLLTTPHLRERFRDQSAEHLERFKPEAVAEKYLSVFRSALRN